MSAIGREQAVLFKFMFKLDLIEIEKLKEALYVLQLRLMERKRRYGEYPSIRS